MPVDAICTISAALPPSGGDVGGMDKSIVFYSSRLFTSHLPKSIKRTLSIVSPLPDPAVYMVVSICCVPK